MKICQCCGQPLRAEASAPIWVDAVLMDCCNTAYAMAATGGAERVEIAHLLLAVAREGRLREGLSRSDIDDRQLAAAAERAIAAVGRSHSGGSPATSAELRDALRAAEALARSRGTEAAGLDDLLSALRPSRTGMSILSGARIAGSGRTASGGNWSGAGAVGRGNQAATSRQSGISGQRSGSSMQFERQSESERSRERNSSGQRDRQRGSAVSSSDRSEADFERSRRETLARLDAQERRMAELLARLEAWERERREAARASALSARGGIGSGSASAGLAGDFDVAERLRELSERMSRLQRAQRSQRRSSMRRARRRLRTWSRRGGAGWGRGNRTAREWERSEREPWARDIADDRTDERLTAFAPPLRPESSHEPAAELVADLEDEVIEEAIDEAVEEAVEDIMEDVFGEEEDDEVDPATGERPKRFYLSLGDDIVDAPSIGPRTAERLRPHGIIKVRDLFKADPADLARRIGARHITAQRIVEWQHQARLVCTIPWLRGTHAQILVGAGYTSAPAIASADKGTLCAAVLRFAGTRDGQRILRSGQPPDVEKVTRWAEYAAQAELDRAA